MRAGSPVLRFHRYVVALSPGTPPPRTTCCFQVDAVRPLFRLPFVTLKIERSPTGAPVVIAGAGLNKWQCQLYREYSIVSWVSPPLRGASSSSPSLPALSHIAPIPPPRASSLESVALPAVR